MALVRFGISMPNDLLREFDACIQGKGYRARSEAIRDLVHDYLVDAQWEAPRGPMIGTVTLVYDHRTRELTHALTELQHAHPDAVVCATHVHLDEHRCLEVIVVKGDAARVRSIADQLISSKGVKHGKLVYSALAEAWA